MAPDDFTSYRASLGLMYSGAARTPALIKDGNTLFMLIRNCSPLQQI